MEQYEMGVFDYICARPDRFVNAQFNIPWDGARGGSCPDFLVLNFRGKTAYIVEITTEWLQEARVNYLQWLKDTGRPIDPELESLLARLSEHLN